MALPRSALAGLTLALGLALGLAWGGGAAAQTAPAVPAEAPDATIEKPAAPSEAPPPAATEDGAARPTSGGFGLTKSQTAGTASGASKGGKTISVLPSDANAPDYAAWERLATRAETVLAAGETSNQGLEVIRGQLADWRNIFTGAQSANANRIATLREQINALGPAPAEGAVEAEEIALRRAALSEQLVRLQAPGLAAEEAYRRASGLIAEIDRVLRERQANELLKLFPTPANPANWPTAATALVQLGADVWTEVKRNWARGDRRAGAMDNLPAVILFLTVAVALVWRGRTFIERLAWRLQGRDTVRGRRVWGFLASLGQVAVPSLGVVLAVSALSLTGMPGTLGQGLLTGLSPAGLTLFLALWLGGRVFPPGEVPAEWVGGTFALSPERRAEGRALVSVLGLMLALVQLWEGARLLRPFSETARAVIEMPLLALTGLTLWRLGHLIRDHVAQARSEGEGGTFRDTLAGLVGRGAIVIGLVGPLVALVGYVNAAAALIYPAAASLGLIALVLVLQELIEDIYALIVPTEGEGGAAQGLVPVLAGFVLVVASLPLFALIWGARADYLLEIWQRFRQGVQVGETRISPTSFLWLLVLFGLGYTVTKLVQGALKSTILPKTKLDQGGRNAITSGVGYLGIFLAGLIAISGAGIDLSSLAFIAGALSLGIGFGLQNIVQNFVSGIILLIERPVSEGDWIEVGAVSGTVKSISVRSTRIQTFDRSDVIVPNADLVTQQVTNWTRFSMAGRLIVPVGVAYGSDTHHVEQVLREIAEAQPLAVLDPPPVVALVGLGADALNFEIRVILRDVNFLLSVRSAINHMIISRFAEEGIEIPFNQADVSLRNIDEIAAALASLGVKAKPDPEGGAA